MADQAVTYEFADGIATIRIDDGKRNALSPAVFAQIYQAFDRAEKDMAIVILTGRESVFSAGFDLKVLRGGGSAALGMLKSGYALTARVMGYPHPVIVACNGHALAMGVFLLLSADHTIGTRGDFKIAANEVAIGLTMPRVAAAMLHHRLTPACYQRAVTLSAYFSVEEARAAGFFDELVDGPDDLLDIARERAAEFAKLDMPAHTASKRRIRGPLIRKIKRSIPLDLLDAILLGLRSKKR